MDTSPYRSDCRTILGLRKIERSIFRTLRGNLEVAVDWLEAAEQGGAGLLIILGCEPTVAQLRVLPRFQLLLKRLGLS